MLLLIGALLAPTVAGAQVPPKDAEPVTREANERVAHELPLGDRADFDDATYGFIGSIPDAEVLGAGSKVVWSMKPFEFLKGDAPSTVNPSLWRHAELNKIHGLFKVTGRVYQVRELDAANMTIIEGDTSLIVIDTLFTTETARAALDLYYKYRPRKPVGTLIYSHSHVDHFGGAKGIVSEEDAASGKVKVLAPAGFMETAVAENVVAGNAMSRRSLYQFGGILPPGPRGFVDVGGGKSIPRGTITLLPPTEVITQSTDRRIDGVDLVFQLVPGAEAPAEMQIYLPQFGVLDAAELVMHSMHNLYAIRGAEIRDPSLWSRYLSNALEKFGNAKYLISQHQWPFRGNENVVTVLKQQRDMYKFINDQTLRYINLGYTPLEIAERLKLPDSLSHEFWNRGYYGTLNTNVKAVYQKYMGWFDGNPANLNPLPPVEAGRKAVEYMGGADAAITRAREDFKKGNYRWVASVMSQVVFADPTNRAARELGADALEQMGYQSESTIWRNAFLVGASELRNDVPKLPSFASLNPETLKAVTTDQYFDYLGVRLNADKAVGKHIEINWNFTDQKRLYILTLENSALTFVTGRSSPTANVSMTLARSTLDSITLKKTTFADAVKSGDITVEGDFSKVSELMGLLDTFNPSFEIVEPKKS
ncbi:alkyl/aryl-sulfatase [Bradyrhizobium altum]|uniref:alkyl/aryl-sulfatase n=1 Tax=Bradyrhizobium altum TaxID=1571202 RepID=UPI001E5CD580|nr:alkyl sulfatase dimerization domain-containing protein [Bradyrhizobium altum]